MAGTTTPATPRVGRKTVDFAVNLVPTLDLLSVLIAFLLLTAVWAQVSRLRVTQTAPRAPATAPAGTPPRALVVHLAAGHARIAFSDEDPSTAVEAPPVGPRLHAELARRAGTNPRAVPVRVETADVVEYRTLIGVLDALADHGLTSVRVGPEAAHRTE